MKEELKGKLIVRGIQFLMLAISLGLLFWVDWRIAVGVMLFGWSQNL